MGNPGSSYRRTRHNLPRQLLSLIPEWPGEEWKSQFKGLYARTPPGCRPPLHLLQPETFMNRSGESVQALASFYKLSPESLLIIHDELELPPGEWKVQRGGGLKGHKGLISLRQQLGSTDFYRLRLGIGRPTRGDVSSWVLGRFSEEEQISLMPALEEAARFLREL